MKFLDAFRKQYENRLQQELVDGIESLLDVGCGSSSPIGAFSNKIPYTLGVDGFAPSLEKSRAQSIHQGYRQMELLKLNEGFEPRSFDAVVSLDVIEHFDKPDSIRLIESMERIARKKVVLFTPNGFLPQGEYDNNPHQLHRCGWTPGELRARGYRVTGINGFKPLRGELAKIRWKPRALWTAISWATQPWVESLPELAFALLAVKNQS